MEVIEGIRRATAPQVRVLGVDPWAMPYAPPIRAICDIALEDAAIGAFGLEILVGAAWLVLAFTTAVVGYRFDREWARHEHASFGPRPINWSLSSRDCVTRSA